MLEVIGEVIFIMILVGLGCIAPGLAMKNSYDQMADPDFLSDKKKQSSAEEQHAGDESEKEVDMKE